jgi:choline dehydrogenase
MLYVCATDRDYNSYAASLPAGNGWDYNSMLPLIKRSEGNTQYNNSYHGTTGPLTVSRFETDDEYIPILKQGFTELGYKINTDYNSKQYNGFISLQGTIRGNERCSASRAFLNPARNRPNLFVMKNSYVTKVLFSGLAATGVNVRTTNANCTNIELFASREVILSAGALQTPKILLQSGVGKVADLPAGVPSVKVLPVGENFQDHVYAINFYKVNPNASSQGLDDLAWDAQNYYFFRNGSASNLNILNHQGFINTLDPNATYADIQLDWYHFRKSQEYLTKILGNFGYKDEFIAFLNNSNVDYEIIMTFTILLNPKSRGTVKTSGADPTLPPKITSGFLTVADDVDVLLRGVKKMDALFNTTGIQSKFSEMVKFNLPECDSLVYKSDSYWRCYFKYFTANLWHPAGTCKMGNAADTGSVVDETLKVRGITKLRVADASIFPTVPSGNTQCPVYSVGQKAADMIIAANP